MLPRSNRLSTEQFNQVMKLGRAHHSSLFLVRTSSIKGHSRVSVTVPTKIAKLAVQRNKFRKKMYEAVRLFFAQIIQDQHIVVIAKAPLLLATQKGIETDMRDVFVKAKLLR